MTCGTDVRLLRRKITSNRLVSPWTLLEDIATWLPPSDERRAMRLIKHHRHQHERVKRAEMIEGAD